jgi:predicted metal-dependent phosphoesterase TrpH
MTSATRTLVMADDPVDLHMHTFASDGRWTAETLSDHLKEQGFRVVAVADHDTMDSVPELVERGERLGLSVVPAVEMTTRWEERQIHCLIFGVDPGSPRSAPFMQLLRRQQDNLAAKAEEIIALLDRHGRRLPSMEAVLEGRPQKPYMVYRAMIRDGHGHDLRTSHNIVKGLGESGLVDVPLAETVEAAHAARALAVIAHPGRDDGWGLLKEPELDRILSEIPIDGVEAHYRSYKNEDTQLYRAWSTANGLVVSAGSDSHWAGFPVNPTPHPARWVEDLLARLGYDVEEYEGPAWVPPEPAAATSSNG